eukprot:4759709-Amphidinium_carterae.1
MHSRACEGIEVVVDDVCNDEIGVDELVLDGVDVLLDVQDEELVGVDELVLDGVDVLLDVEDEELVELLVDVEEEVGDVE